MDISLMPRNAHVALQELYADPDIGNSRSGVDIIKQKMEECSFSLALTLPLNEKSLSLPSLADFQPMSRDSLAQVLLL
jgi:hypothetical protein